MKCLSKYKWIKLYRAALPQGKGIMGYWARLAGRAAFRHGKAKYCGHTNTVTPGMWSGGIVGLKNILGVKRRSQALQIMNELQDQEYVSGCRVSLSDTYTRAYFSHGRNCKYIVGNSMLHLSLHSYVDSVVMIIESRYRKEMAPRGCHYLTQI